jgi:hypothetical protein
MIKTSKTSKILRLLTVPLVLAAIISFVAGNSIKTRYSSELSVSPIYTQDTIAIEALRIYLGYDPTSRFLDNFMAKLNFGINNNENVCSTLEKNNRIRPLHIIRDKEGLRIQFSSINKKILSECSLYLEDAIENENKRIGSFLTKIIELKQESQLKKTGKISIETLLSYYDRIERKIIDNTDLSRDERKQFLLNHITKVIPTEDYEYYDEKMNINSEYLPMELNVIKDMQFLQIIGTKSRAEKKVNNYFLFVGFFITFFIINISINKSFFNRKRFLSIAKKIVG